LHARKRAFRRGIEELEAEWEHLDYVVKHESARVYELKAEFEAEFNRTWAGRLLNRIGNISVAVCVAAA
jgi:hypothetical protein